MTEKTTLIDENVLALSHIPNVTEEKDPAKIMMDFSNPVEVRISALNRYYEIEGKDNTVEYVNKLVTMYELSGTKLLREYLFKICDISEIDPFLQSLAARALRSHDKTDNLGYTAITKVYPKLNGVGTPYKIDFVKMLMTSESHKEKALEYFLDIINDKRIDCDFRYKAIANLEVLDNENLPNPKLLDFYLINSCIEFLRSKSNMTLYRILAGQNLMRMKTTPVAFREEAETTLFGFAEDTLMDYNLRADASDVIMQLGSTPEVRERSQRIILRLGVGNQNRSLNIYENLQNVHTKEVDDSVKEALAHLQLSGIEKRMGTPITVQYVEKKLESLLRIERESLGLGPTDKFEKEEKVKIALNRIIMDRALYSVYNCTLAHILLLVWTYLAQHDSREELEKRLLEELSEMAGTCSSGFAARLVNVLSGFADFSIRISWESQIGANLSGRLNARVREMDDIDAMEKILEEMALPSELYEHRGTFLKFFRENIPSLRDELYQEFKEFITDSQFDLFFRTAVSMYEIGSF
jgi:hypothetical protein